MSRSNVARRRTGQAALVLGIAVSIGSFGCYEAGGNGVLYFEDCAFLEVSCVDHRLATGVTSALHVRNENPDDDGDPTGACDGAVGTARSSNPDVLDVTFVPAEDGSCDGTVEVHAVGPGSARVEVTFGALEDFYEYDVADAAMLTITDPSSLLAPVDAHRLARRTGEEFLLTATVRAADGQPLTASPPTFELDDLDLFGIEELESLGALVVLQGERAGETTLRVTSGDVSSEVRLVVTDD